MGSLFKRSVLKRLEEVERVLMENGPDNILEGFYFEPIGGGIFGHVHSSFNKVTGDSVDVACPDEEEIEIMRYKYEEWHHKFWGQGEVLSFPDFLERCFYLSPNIPDERKKAVVQKLREAENSLPNPGADSL